MGDKNERAAFYASWGRANVRAPIRVVSEKDLLREEIACLRLLKLIAEQERDDAIADARALRLCNNELEIREAAAIGVGRRQEEELDELRAHINALSHDEFDAVMREQELRGWLNEDARSLHATAERIRRRLDLRS